MSPYWLPSSIRMRSTVRQTSQIVWLNQAIGFFENSGAVSEVAGDMHAERQMRYAGAPKVLESDYLESVSENFEPGALVKEVVAIQKSSVAAPSLHSVSSRERAGFQTLSSANHVSMRELRVLGKKLIAS